MQISGKGDADQVPCKANDGRGTARTYRYAV